MSAEDLLHLLIVLFFILGAFFNAGCSTSFVRTVDQNGQTFYCLTAEEK